MVETPVAPSPPAALTTLVIGDTVSFAWQNTFAGGAPTSLWLEASGSLSASMPVPLSDTLTLNGVPPGAYAVTLRAVNAAGASAPTSPVNVVVPELCSGPPAAPTQFLAYADSQTVHLVWEAPAAGAAASRYLVNVTGSYTGTLATRLRSIAPAAPPGVYVVSVSAVNACGVSAPTTAQTVVVP